MMRESMRYESTEIAMPLTALTSKTRESMRYENTEIAMPLAVHRYDERKYEVRKYRNYYAVNCPLV